MACHKGEFSSAIPEISQAILVGSASSSLQRFNKCQDRSSVMERATGFAICNWPWSKTNTQAKEGLFNILQNQVEFDGAKTLDLFGGTGSISYELASRGAASLTIIEKDQAMFQFIKDNIQKLGIQNC